MLCCKIRYFVGKYPTRYVISNYFTHMFRIYIFATCYNFLLKAGLRQLFHTPPVCWFWFRWFTLHLNQEKLNTMCSNLLESLLLMIFIDSDAHFFSSRLSVSSITLLLATHEALVLGLNCLGIQTGAKFTPVGNNADGCIYL